MYIFARKMTCKPTKYVVFDEVYSFTAIWHSSCINITFKNEIWNILIKFISFLLINFIYLNAINNDDNTRHHSPINRILWCNENYSNELASCYYCNVIIGYCYCMEKRGFIISLKSNFSWGRLSWYFASVFV